MHRWRAGGCDGGGELSLMLVKAIERFTLLGCGFEDRSLTGLPEPSNYSDRWTIYVCPTCDTQTGFEWSDFHKHVGSNFSNLRHPDREAIEREVDHRLTDENSFLDCYCSGCEGAVRVDYRYESPEERMHGERIELKTVVEPMPPGIKPHSY